MKTYRCVDCGETVSYHDEDVLEHGHARWCEGAGAQVCDCPPGYKHRPDCPLVADEGEAA